eukprot:TRINITY_DN2313_c0_g1_i3.p1 TRINITY_DN2313_c0_g1~~TRINITY_DN2313_c0_g1_i3.p1  ORF type:complete len:140 (+),score=19.70 TRINITY_DN2313_c0_g1_i3:37-420(+)
MYERCTVWVDYAVRRGESQKVGVGGIWRGCFFFFKQKTAYEMQRGLVGSEMCIRDRAYIMVALYSGLLNYKMTEMPEEEIKKIWQEGVRLIVSREGQGENLPYPTNLMIFITSPTFSSRLCSHIIIK